MKVCLGAGPPGGGAVEGGAFTEVCCHAEGHLVGSGERSFTRSPATRKLGWLGAGLSIGVG